MKVDTVGPMTYDAGHGAGRERAEAEGGEGARRLTRGRPQSCSV